MKKPKMNDLVYDEKGTKEIRQLVKNAKTVKITINIDENVVLQLKENASKSGVPYQRIINKILAKNLEEEKTLEQRVYKLEKEILKLTKKLIK